MDKKIKENIDNIFPCQLPFLKLSCFGCCGRDWKNKNEILKDLKENTKEFNSIKHKSIIKLLEFRDRLSSNPDDLKPSGLCSNIVDFGNNCIACPLHPKINEIIDKKTFLFPTKKDLRINHCDVNYECETLTFWKIMKKQDKIEFIKWIEKKKYSNYQYSIENVEGISIRKFLDEKGIKLIDN